MNVLFTLVSSHVIKVYFVKTAVGKTAHIILKMYQFKTRVSSNHLQKAEKNGKVNLAVNLSPKLCGCGPVTYGI